MIRLTRRKVKIVLGSIAGLILLLLLTAILVVQTAWFRDFVRAQIIASAEESTGGKVEIGSFDFEWTHLRATIRNFVLHGTEAAGQAPLFQADLLQLDLRLFSGLTQAIDLAALRVDQPRANVIVYPDGRTNVPEPKVKSKPGEPPFQTLVDLKIGHFDLQHGSIAFNARKAQFSAKGDNLKAALGYSPVGPGYRGSISMDPLDLVSGGNAPARLKIALPVAIEKNEIAIKGGTVETDVSRLSVDVTADHLSDPQPHISGHLKARVALAEALRSSGTSMPIATGKDLPTTADAEIACDLNGDSIRVSTARLSLGDSHVEASGDLKDTSGHGAMKFTASLAAGQLGRLLRVESQPQGVVTASGEAKLIGASDYSMKANIHGNALGFRQGQQRFQNISVTGDVAADSKRIELAGLKLNAFGGTLTGKGGLEELRRFHFAGALGGFDIEGLARAFAALNLPYNGVISGPVEASGDLKAPGTKGLAGRVRLAIAPSSSRTGVPVSGSLNVSYDGALDIVSIDDSHVALPHTRLDLAGALDHEVTLKLALRDLRDIQPVLDAAAKGKPRPLPVELRNGSLNFTGGVTGKLSSPRLAGYLEATGFAVEDRPFDRLAADISASASGVGVRNGTLARASMGLRFNVSVGLHEWKPEDSQPLSADATIQNAGLADLLAIAGQKDMDASGTVNATARIGGTIGSPTGSTSLTVADGAAYGEHFDRLTAQVDLADRMVRLSKVEVTAGTARIAMNASFQHPSDSFESGELQAHIESDQMPLEQFQAVRNQSKGLKGIAQLQADAMARIAQENGQTAFQLTSLNANASAKGLEIENRKLGDLTASAQTGSGNLDFRLGSDFAGSKIQVNGRTRLEKSYPTTATASIDGLPLEQVLAVAERRDIPVRGNLSAKAQLSGTLDDPNATVDLNLVKAVVYNEPLDRVEGRVTYNNLQVSLANLKISEGPAQIEVSGSLDHPKGDFEQGKVQFRVTSNQIALGKLHVLTERRPGLNGALELQVDGAGTLRKVPQGSTELPVEFTSLNANLNAHGLEVDRKALGDLTFKATTQGNANLQFALDSDLGQSAIHAQGQATLSGDYPVKAHLSFSNVTYSGLGPLFGPPPKGIDALVEGQADIQGPLQKPEGLSGNLTLSKLEMTAKQHVGLAAADQQVRIANDGPIVVALNRQAVNIQSAHLVSDSKASQPTDIRITGSAGLSGNTALNLHVTAKTDLKLVQDFDRDVVSSGNADLDLQVRGTATSPALNGELHLRNASFNMMDLPNGLSNVNGAVRFNNTTASLQNIKGETGGGTVTLGGFVAYANSLLRYGVRADAAQVRVRTPEGASVVVSAAVSLTGTSDHSLLSGNVTVNRIAFNPKSDLGSLLSRSAPPVETPEEPSGLLAGMNLDVRIRTAPDLAFQTSLAQNLQADADLILRGTLASPGMTGRVNVTSGQLVFFGSTYDVNSGSVSFFNPLKIDPILNVDLETKAQGVDVILNVSGPVNNMKLTYTSDPPLQFNEIVGLLAAGKTPTSDPTILANQPQPPPQSFQQMGESAIVSQAVANPVSSRLQRVFGVSQFKIDPTFVSGSTLPQARLTLQQQVAENITFTYITDLTQSNSEIIRVEWTFSPRWSAVATRDEDGRFGVDFFFKKQYR